jgi:hypothetical protein
MPIPDSDKDVDQDCEQGDVDEKPVDLGFLETVRSGKFAEANVIEVWIVSRQKSKNEVSSKRKGERPKANEKCPEIMLVGSGVFQMKNE